MLAPGGGAETSFQQTVSLCILINQCCYLQMEEYHRLKEKVCTQATQLHQKLESVQRDQRLDEENVHQCKQRASELQARRQQLSDQRIQLQNRLDHLDSYLELVVTYIVNT